MFSGASGRKSYKKNIFLLLSHSLYLCVCGGCFFLLSTGNWMLRDDEIRLNCLKGDIAMEQCILYEWLSYTNPTFPSLLLFHSSWSINISQYYVVGIVAEQIPRDYDGAKVLSFSEVYWIVRMQ